MNLCNRGEQPVLEAITHWAKARLIYTVHNANLIPHFVLSLVCKSSRESIMMVHNFAPYYLTRTVCNTSMCSCLYYSISNDKGHIFYSTDQMSIKFLIIWFQFDHGNFAVNCKMTNLSIKWCSWIPAVFIAAVCQWRWQCGSNSKDTFLRLMDKLQVSLARMLFLWPTLAGSLCFMTLCLYHLCIDGNKRFWG